MTMSIEEFGEKARQALQAAPGVEGRNQVKALLEALLSNPAFDPAYFPPEETSPRKLLYEDPELGFCVFSHVHKGASSSKPHDHGPSWAIYGQAFGETEMREWRKKGDSVELATTYKMSPGHAYVYNEGDIHSPSRTDETHLIRIEGMNLEGMP
ncbi:MAG: hypothetical protein K0U93_23645, partial [Gammaproteobacteria bacterium]|nr:hypothetical protein [Gammaproteobacteria bacterium]